MFTLCVHVSSLVCSFCMFDGSPHLPSDIIVKIFLLKLSVILYYMPKLMLVNCQHGFWKGPDLKSMAEVSYLARFGLVQDARTAGLFL